MKVHEFKPKEKAYYAFFEKGDAYLSEVEMDEGNYHITDKSNRRLALMKATVKKNYIKHAGYYVYGFAWQFQRTLEDAVKALIMAIFEYGEETVEMEEPPWK